MGTVHSQNSFETSQIEPSVNGPIESSTTGRRTSILPEVSRGAGTMQLSSRKKRSGTETHEAASEDQRGAAVVEFALIASLLFVLLFGIVEFGFILSIKSSVTQAAAEGARAAAVTAPWCPAGSTCQYPSGSPAGCTTNSTVEGVDYSCLYQAAQDQANKTMSWLGSCSDSGALQCTSTADYCTPGDSSSGVCITTKVSYDYAHHPIFAPIPLLNALLPSTIPAQTVVKVNPCAPPTQSGGPPRCG
jgi:Flp pilus assembly pilin Flp